MTLRCRSLQCLSAAVVGLTLLLLSGCSANEVEYDWTTPNPEERLPDVLASTTIEGTWTTVRQSHPEPAAPVTERPPVLATTEPPTETSSSQMVSDNETDPVEPIFVSGEWSCLGDVRWAAGYPRDELGSEPPRTWVVAQWDMNHVSGTDDFREVICPTPDLPPGRYWVEADLGCGWFTAPADPLDPDVCGDIAIQPWREPENARSQGWCWRSLYDGPILDTADCPAPQFLSVGSGDRPWTIAFVPEEGQ